MGEMGDKIKALRKERGMTLEELGDKIGVGKSTVRKWENGMIENMRRDKIAKLAKALGVTPGFLMGWDENTDQDQKTGQDKSYYVNKETADVANEILHNSDMRILFDAAKGSDAEALKMAAAMLRKMKGDS